MTFFFLSHINILIFRHWQLNVSFLPSHHLLFLFFVFVLMTWLLQTSTVTSSMMLPIILIWRLFTSLGYIILLLCPSIVEIWWNITNYATLFHNQNKMDTYNFIPNYLWKIFDVNAHMRDSSTNTVPILYLLWRINFHFKISEIFKKKRNE